jgi:hypothetical protein
VELARSSNAIPWALIALMSGGFLYRPAADSGLGSGSGRAATTGPASRAAAAKKRDGQPAPDLHRDALDVLGDHFGIDLTDRTLQDRDKRRLEILKNAVGAIDVTTVIATLPDPIDSNVRWLFDPMLDAIQRAASDAHYVLDRFYIPDWNPEQNSDTDHSSEPAGAHERWPGVVLFRGAASTGPVPLLMVFLVSETATSGVHQTAFAKALDDSLLTRVLSSQPTRADAFAILGPSFSGSVDSMLRTLRRFSGDHPSAHFRIVSGGATASDVQSQFENDSRLTGRVSYRATVVPDNMLLTAIEQHLLRVDPGIDQPGKIAILREANTEYGSSIAADSHFGSAAFPSQWPPLIQHAIWLPFPMHISRVRSEAQPAQSAAKTQVATAPRRFSALDLSEPDKPTDQIPAFSPQLTSAAVELMIANMVDTIRRQRVRAVGLIATDARDKLFLAQQVSAYAPGVILFTIESDLMFIHPDYNKYVRGMIVASTYPLFAANQLWTAPSSPTGLRPGLQQFSSTNSEGVYNALLALVAYDVNGAHTPGTSPPLLDYRPPAPEPCFNGDCIPPAWISVVESDAIWPVGYTFPVQKTERMLGSLKVAPYPAQAVQLAALGPADDQPIVRLSIGMGLLLVLFVASACTSVALLVRWHWLLPRRAHRTEPRGFDRAAAATRYQRVALATIAITGLAIAFVCYSALRLTWAAELRIDHGIEVAAIGAEILVVCAFIVACVMRDRTAIGTAAVRGNARLLRAVIGAVTLIVVVLGTFKGVLYLWRMWSSPAWPVGFIRFLTRTLEIGSGVSPILPLVLLSLPTLCWAILQLWRVGGPTLARVSTSEWIAQVAGDDGEKWRARLHVAWLNPSGGLPASWLSVILAVFAAIFFACWTIAPSTIEPIAFSQFLGAVWLVAQLCIALTLAHAVYLWSLNQGLLDALNASRLADAFARLPREIGVYGYLSPAPTRADLVRPACFYNALGDEMTTLPANAFDAATAAALAADFALPRPDGMNNIQHLPWSDTSTFAQLLNGAGVIYSALQTRWPQRPSTMFERKATVDTVDPVERWTLRAEEYLAMLITLVIRQLSARVVRELLFVTIGLVLVIVALSWFPIYPLQPVIGYAWIWAALAAAAGIWVSVTMERDPILSRLTRTPNRVQWNLAFATKLIVYVGIPLVTFFAAQFPQAGGTLLRWLTPIQPLP